MFFPSLFCLTLCTRNRFFSLTFFSFLFFPRRFFRRVCDEYFRPGGFPPSSPPGGGQGVPNGAGGEGMAGTGGGADGGGAGDGDGDGGAAMTESLRQAMLRADYVNSLNAFNQLPVSMTAVVFFFFSIRTRLESS